jgi:hypothetical protein
MIADCAIDPEIFATWSHFRSLSEDFGIARGRLISEFPGKWRKRVIERARELAAADTPERITTDLQASRIALKLSEDRFKRKLKNSGRAFDSLAKDWYQAAVAAAPPFDLIITTGSGTSGNQIGANDLLKDEYPFHRKTQDLIRRTKEELIGAARLLVSTCDEFILVDPNFRADEPRFHETVLYLISLLEGRAGWSPKRLEVHTNRIRNRDDVYRRGPQLSQWRTHIQPALPSGWNLDVCYWDTMPSGGKPHARFLLTEQGGIYFDHGLDEGPGQTLVTLLEDEVWEGLFRTFDARSIPGAFDADQHVLKI